jgi:aryl-alcohol dehydrogenase-like predicted oxidoreductase
MTDLTRAEFLRLGMASAAALACGVPARAQTPGDFAMETRPIPKTGEALPAIGCGTWRTFDVDGSDPEIAERAEVLRTLIDAGGKVIDSSPMYGSSETVVGKALGRIGGRTRAFVATKVWTSGRAAGIRQMEESLDKLGADPIDLMQIHNLLDWRTQLATLRDWKAAGRVRYVGVTHYHDGAFDDLAAVLKAEEMDFVQFNYALDDRAAEAMLLPLAADRGVAVLINRPFGGGGLLRRVGSRPLPGWAAEIGAASWAQALLKFILANPAVSCAIPGAGSVRHMADNVRAADGRYPDAALRRRMIAEVLG